MKLQPHSSNRQQEGDTLCVMCTPACLFGEVNDELVSKMLISIYWLWNPISEVIQFFLN